MDDLLSFPHADLCELAVKWLKRPQSQSGHGCHIALTECRSGWSGEVPDAIGFRAAGYKDGSVVVEVKVSRADYLADRKKPHRQPGEGMGNWRYFMCPEGMIQAHELPQGWGLLWVNRRGHIKPIAGPAAFAKGSYTSFEQALDEYHQKADIERERWLLVKLLNRVGDPEELNLKVRAAYGEQQRLAAKCNKQADEIQNLKAELRAARRAVIGEEMSPVAMARTAL